MSTEIAAILDEAAALLERDGWCQGVNYEPTARRCAVTAIGCAIPGTAFDGYLGMYIRAMAAVTKVLPSGDLMEWNDAIGRTADEVTALFRRVAAAERGAAQ